VCYIVKYRVDERLLTATSFFSCRPIALPSIYQVSRHYENADGTCPSPDAREDGSNSAGS
jgi:hypothetical protein